MQTMILSYSVQAFHADGKAGVAASFESSELADREAARWVTECGYAWCSVEVWEGCTACKGHGRHAKRTRGRKPIPFAYVECKECKGRGMWIKTGRCGLKSTDS